MTTIAAPHTTALTTELRYLALGDSYTIGEGVDEAGRWPMQLARLLRMEGILLGDPRIIATTGWTTDELWAAMDAAEPIATHGFVSLLIGVNNQYRGRSVEEYRTQFAALLWRAIGFARNRPDRLAQWAAQTKRTGEEMMEIVRAAEAQSPQVPAALGAIAAEFRRLGVTTGSHDDDSAETRASAPAESKLPRDSAVIAAPASRTTSAHTASRASDTSTSRGAKASPIRWRIWARITAITCA